jgi:hypothetical protein
MNIQSISNYNITPSYKGLFSKKTKEKYCENSIEIQKHELPQQIAVSNQREDVFFTEFLNKKGKVTKKEYEDILKNHPSAIVKSYKFVEKIGATATTPAQCAKAALKLKESYDKEYKGNYSIVSIGTSPSPITEAMSALGAKVIFIPASGLNMLSKDRLYIFRSQYPTTSSRIPNIKYIAEYMKKNSSTLKKTDFLILLDYCCSGTSLDNMCQIFEEENIHPSERMHDRSILSDLCELTNLKDETSTFKLEEYANIAHDMQCSSFEEVSNVPHFHIYDQYNENVDFHISSKNKSKRQLFREFDNFSRPLARAYALCTINEAMKLSK